MLLNPRATESQKAKAVGKVAEVTAGEAVKSTIKKTVTPARIEKAKQYVKENKEKAIELLKQGVVVAGQGKMYFEAKKKTAAAMKAEYELKQTEKRMKRKLTKAEADTLRKQYKQFFEANPNAKGT